MFSQATAKIYSIENNYSAINSRVSMCENEIYKMQHCAYDEGPIWDKIATIEYEVYCLKEQLIEIQTSLKVLSTSINEHINAARADLAVKSEKPKQKIDLEISEQNDGFEVDPYTTPQYYLDDKKNNDYWYWNGEQ